MADNGEGVPPPAQRPSFTRVELLGAKGLGRDVAIDLDPKRTVLVGRNGAGKSLILHAFRGAAAVATEALVVHAPPRGFVCDVVSPDNQSIRYSYAFEHGVDEEATDDERPVRGRVRAERRESCIDLTSGAELWAVHDRALWVGPQRICPLPAGVGLLGVEQAVRPDLAAVARHLSRMFHSIRLVDAGVVRDARSGRAEVLLEARHMRDRRVWTPVSTRSRLGTLAARVASTWERRRPVFEELVAVLARLGLASDVSVDVFTSNTMRGTDEGAGRELGFVTVDGVNLGLQSDGTLRVIEIIMELVGSSGSILLIEEPETALHPALLEALQGELESYGSDLQIVIATHSPAVVDKADAGQLRLVTRSHGRTRVAPLVEAERASLREHLCTDALSDFVFAREDRLVRSPLAVLAEDRTDCDALRVIVKRIATQRLLIDEPRVLTFPSGGCAKLRRKAADKLAEFARQGCRGAILVHDLDRHAGLGVLRDEAALRRELEAIERPSEWPVLICIPVEELETWFWSDDVVVKAIGRGFGSAVRTPASVAQPKEALIRLSRDAGNKPRYSTNDNAKYAAMLDLDLCAQRCPSFASFLAFTADILRTAAGSLVG